MGIADRVQEDIKRAKATGERLRENGGKNPSHKKSYTSNTSNTDAASNLHQDEKILHQGGESYTVGDGELVYRDEDGKANRIIESDAALVLTWAMRGKFAYAVQAAVWHVFTGTHWQPCESAAEAEKFIVGALYTGTSPIGFRPGYMAGIMKIMLAADMLPLPPEPVGKIPFLNGLLSIATRQLEPATPENAATWRIPHHYVTGTDCPVFMAWLRSATGGDEGLILLLRAFINACLTGRADLQKFLHLLGPGGTGKSTLIRLLFAMLGPSNCASTDLRRLEQNQFETATLYGKRLAAITDSDKYGGAVNVLKAITGQDPVRNERKHVQQSGTFIFEGMVLIASNEPLASTDYTSGLERRRLVIQFDRRIPPEEKATFLAAGGEDRLHREIPAIINWALDLSREEVTTTFMHPPQKAVEAAFESLTAQNPIAEWITHSIIPEPGGWVSVGVKSESRTPGGTVLFEDADSKLYPNYLRWCGQNKREALALRRFRHAVVDMVKTMGTDVVESRRSAGQGMTGIRLRRDYEGPHQWPGMAAVQDESYTPTPASVGKKAPEPAPVQEVREVQDFCPEIFENFPTDPAPRRWDYQHGCWVDEVVTDGGNTETTGNGGDRATGTRARTGRYSAAPEGPPPFDDPLTF
ncbi:DNA primase family protein [Methylomagnum sp.]